MPDVVLICGSRDIKHDALIKERIYQLDRDDIVIHGGARGADLAADWWARERGMTVEIFVADWKTYGKRAGYVRNTRMLDAEPDYVIAFWNGTSKGTKHTIDEARKRDIPVEVIKC